jgi:hypothetical protein
MVHLPIYQRYACGVAAPITTIRGHTPDPAVRELGASWPIALRLAVQNGLSVFPLVRGAKVPLAGTRGVLDASADPEHIAAWARKHPYSNYGVAGGGRTNLLVLDFETIEAAQLCTDRYGARPLAPTVATPKGGTHEYGLLPDGMTIGNSCRKLGPDIDTRGQHGYVVGPGSVLVDGRGWREVPGRGFDDLDMPVWPAPLIAALQEAPVAKPVARPNAKLPSVGCIDRRVAGYLRVLPALRDGEGRHATGYRLAAFVLHDCGGSLTDAAVALAVWNGRNHAPLAQAKLDVLIADAERYGGRHAA